VFSFLFFVFCFLYKLRAPCSWHDELAVLKLTARLWLFNRFGQP